MFVLKAKALSGRELIEKHDSAQDAYERARKWIAVGFSDVRLMQEGGPWHHGAQEIRAFIEQLKPVHKTDPRMKPGPKEDKRGPGDPV